MPDETAYDGTSGDDTLRGSWGDDTFIFAAGHGNDTITDFTDGEDAIDLTAISGISGFQDLTIAADGSAAVIDLTEYGGGTIRLENTDVTDLDTEDFVFSAPPVSVSPPPLRRPATGRRVADLEDAKNTLSI